MEFEFLNTITTKLEEIGNFLFSSFTGVGILLITVLLTCFVVAAILEKKTKLQFKNHPKEEELEVQE